jgi:cytidylate kinase
MKIAIDGPAGAGKSTIALLVAKRLGLRYLDTGAMYRAVTLQALRTDTACDNGRTLVDMLTKTDLVIEFELETGRNLVYINGENVTEAIRKPEVTGNVSLVSSHAELRELIVAMQQEIARPGRIVMDGRDIGTVVMPDAQWKFFLWATVEERALRRQKQLAEAGFKVDLAELEEQIRQRDHFDSHREVSPLRKAEDAIEVDTTNLTISEVVDSLLRWIRGGSPDV